MIRLLISSLAAGGVLISAAGLALPAEAAVTAPTGSVAHASDGVVHPFAFDNETKYELRLDGISGDCYGRSTSYIGPAAGYIVQPWDGQPDATDTMNYDLTYFVFGCGTHDDGDYIDLSFDAIDPASGKSVGTVSFRSKVANFFGTDYIESVTTTVPGTTGGGVGQWSHTAWVRQS